MKNLIWSFLGAAAISIVFLFLLLVYSKTILFATDVPIPIIGAVVSLFVAVFIAILSTITQRENRKSQIDEKIAMLVSYRINVTPDPIPIDLLAHKINYDIQAAGKIKRSADDTQKTNLRQEARALILTMRPIARTSANRVEKEFRRVFPDLPLDLPADE